MTDVQKQNVQTKKDLQEIRAELIAAMQEVMEDSKVKTLLKEYDLLDAMKFEMSLDKEKLQAKQNISIDQETMLSLEEISIPSFTVISCSYCPPFPYTYSCCNGVANPCAGCP